jgi:hypothetical protein
MEGHGHYGEVVILLNTHIHSMYIVSRQQITFWMVRRVSDLNGLCIPLRNRLSVVCSTWRIYAVTDSSITSRYMQ